MSVFGVNTTEPQTTRAPNAQLLNMEARVSELIKLHKEVDEV